MSYIFGLENESESTISGIVEVDEMLPGKKAKYHRGTSRQAQWMIGIKQRNSNKCIVEFIPNRNKETIRVISIFDNDLVTFPGVVFCFLCAANFCCMALGKTARC